MSAAWTTGETTGTTSAAAMNSALPPNRLRRLKRCELDISSPFSRRDGGQVNRTWISFLQECNHQERRRGGPAVARPSINMLARWQAPPPVKSPVKMVNWRADPSWGLPAIFPLRFKSTGHQTVVLQLTVTSPDTQSDLQQCPSTAPADEPANPDSAT